MSTKEHRCVPCNKTFSDKWKLKRHLENTSTHDENPPQHDCKICHKRYRTIHGLNQHHKINHDKILPSKRQCDLCDKSYADGKGLKQHLMNFHGQGEKPHKCEYCGYSFVWVTLKNKHVRMAHLGEKSETCKFCSKKFALKSTLKNHSYTAHKYCIECDVVFETKQIVRSHKTEIHQRVKSICKFCNVEFPGRLLVHYRLLHFYCSEKCDTQFESKVDLKKHLQDFHSEEAFDHYLGERYKCKFCEKRFRKKNILDGHYKKSHSFCLECDLHCIDKNGMQTHNKDVHQLDFTCPICLKVFVQKIRFDDHKERKVSEKKEYQCDICHKILSAKNSLEHHINVLHQNIKPSTLDVNLFSCDQCAYTTNSKYSLKSHIERHEVAYTKCDICQKMVLKIEPHMKRMHTTESTKQCDMCDSKFKTDGDLKMHVRNVHLEVNYQKVKCEICGEELNKGSISTHKRNLHKKDELEKQQCDQCEFIGYTMQSLIAHAKIHLGITYECDLCDYKCITKGTFKEHKRSHLPANDQLKCPDCPFFTHSQVALSGHQRKHLPEEELTCKKCSYVCVWKSTMRDHSLTSHNEKINCDICDFFDWSAPALKQHVSKNHKGYQKSENNKTFKCKHCDLIASSAPEIKRHAKKCEKIEERYVCEVCQKQYSSLIARTRHTRKDHENNEVKSQNM